MLRPFRDDSQEIEELRQLLTALQSTLGTTVRELAERLQDVGDSVESSQRILSEDARSVARQVANLNGCFNEIAKYLEESFTVLQQRAKSTETSSMARFDAIDKTLLAREDRADAQADGLREQMQSQAKRLETIESTLARLDDWKYTLPPDEDEDEAGWFDGMISALRRLAQSGELRGRASLFTKQLARNLQELQKISTHVEVSAPAYWAEEATIQELDRVLFRPHASVEWVEISEQDYGTAGLKSRARAELRALETAVLNYRCLLQKRLEERHAFKTIYVVPHQTLFDPVLHETTEMYSLPTQDSAKNNIVTGIERNGYQLGGEVLRRAFVRRLVWDESARPTPVETDEASGEEPTTETVPLQEKSTLSPAATEDGLSEEEKERRAAAIMNR